MSIFKDYPLPPFHLVNALDECLENVEEERHQLGNELYNEDHKNSLTRLVIGMSKLIQVETQLRQEKGEYNSIQRYFSGSSPEHPAYTDYDASDYVRGDIISALSVMEFPRIATLLQEIFRKESTVTRGDVLHNVKISQKRIARKGADVSRTHKQNLLDLIESLSCTYCADFAQCFPNRSITITMIANAIHSEVIQYMLSSPTLIGVYRINEEEQQYPDRCSRIDSIKKNLSILKKNGKLQPWLSSKK